MVGYWVSFGLIAFSDLLAFPFLKIIAHNFGTKVITPEMNRKANIKVVFYIIYAWLLDLFYMSMFINNIVCKFIFGGLIMINTFISLANEAAFPREKHVVDKWIMVFDFIIGVAISVYLMYIIPNQTLQNIIIPIVSAIYGGLLTLVGVALTIKQSNADKKEDEIKKAKPLVFVLDKESRKHLGSQIERKTMFSETQNGSLESAKDGEKSYCLHYFGLANSDYSYCTVRGFVINRDYHFYDYGQVLAKNVKMNFRSDFKFKYNKEIKYVAILLQDMMDNYYELEVQFKLIGDTNKTIQVLSSLKQKKASIEFVESKEV